MPLSLACDVHARFVLVDDLRLRECRFQALFHQFQMPGAACDQRAERRPLTHRDPQQVFHHFSSPCQRQELLLHQAHCDGSAPRPVLDRSTDFLGKRGQTDVMAAQALFLLGLMLDNQQSRAGDIHDLPTLDGSGWDRLQVLLTVLTPRERMHHDLIGRQGEAQAVAWMVLLPSWFLPALLAQTLGLPHKPIRGRWQVTVVAVFTQPFFQVLQALLQLCDQLISLGQLLTQGSLLLFQSGDSFFWTHGATLQFLPLSGKSLGDLGSYSLQSLT